MKGTQWWIIAVCLAAGSVGQGCDDGDDGADERPDTETAVKIVDSITGATPGVTSAVLGPNHEGWRRAACFSCHDGFHPNNYVVGDCVSCHGDNGASTRPPSHADLGCLDCHGDRHADLSLASVDGCRACHGTESAGDTCAYQETYDAIVIGGGGGGLSAAAVLAEKGAKVLLVEQHYKTGGCMVVFHRGDYRFEASLHAYDGWGMSYLGALNIKNALIPKKGDIMYRLIFPDMTFDVPADKVEYQEALKRRFQEESDGIDSLFESFGIAGFDRYEGMSLLDAVLSNGIRSERLIGIFTALSGFLASTPEAVPAEAFLGMWDSYHTMGYYYFEGGSQSITFALEEKIISSGGVIKRHTRASRITVDDLHVTGIRTEDGGCYSARAVISAISAKTTFFSLVGKEHLPEALVEEVERRAPAPSNLAVVFLGVDADYTHLFPGQAHELFVASGDLISSDDIDEVQCNPESVGLTITNYSVADPLAAPDGKNAIAITADFMDYDCDAQWRFSESYESYAEYKTAVANVLVSRAEAFLPGLLEHIEVMEVASPKTVEQFTLSDRGSWAGWSFEPGVEHQYTEAVETPIAGLFMSGAWVAGSGQSVALASGIAAASAAMQMLEP